jgi:hypothetical protein
MSPMNFCFDIFYNFIIMKKHVVEAITFICEDPLQIPGNYVIL